jgi:hypothetical protein
MEEYSKVMWKEFEFQWRENFGGKKFFWDLDLELMKLKWNSVMIMNIYSVLIHS